MRFTVVEEFFSPATNSHYIAGLSYTVRPEDDRLREMVVKWIADGKVIEGGPEATVVGKE